MTILEDIKSGRLVVVPRGTLEADAVVTLDMVAVMKKELVVLRDTPNLNLGMAMSRAILARQGASASPDHTAGLIALVEGMERERDEALASLNASRNLVERRTKQRDSEAERADGNWDAAQAAEARALAAEAERDALREAASLSASAEPVDWKALFEAAHGALICIAEAHCDAAYARKVADDLTAAAIREGSGE